MIDEEEYACLQAQRAWKGKYRDAHAAMVGITKEIDSLAAEEDAERQALLHHFNGWYVEQHGVAPEDAVRSRGELMKANGLDDDEAFEKLETERLIGQAPDSLAFVRASRAAKLKGRAKR